jgi:phospholipid transport system transporter-binding protein
VSSRYEFRDLGEGHFALDGEMSFATVSSILRESLDQFADHTMIEVNLAGVEKTDSAGLALLLEWITWANHTVREIHFRNIPEKISNIAQTSDVDELLTVGERWVGFIEDRGGDAASPD